MTDRISQRVLEFTNCSNQEISFRLFVLIKCQNVRLFVLCCISFSRQVSADLGLEEEARSIQQK